MGHGYKKYFYAISLVAIIPTTHAVAGTDWLPYQNTLRPQAGQSLNNASLSPETKISTPDINLPENISFFSGIWAGSICDGFSEVIIAVVELATEEASIVYSLGNYVGSFNNQEYSANIVDGELAGRTETGIEVILGKRTVDEYLNIKWIWGDDTEQRADTMPKICYGVLQRE